MEQTKTVTVVKHSPIPDIDGKPSKQYLFLSIQADIIFFGGAAGGSKTYAALLEALRHTDKKTFRCTIFRRTYADIIKQGGIWDDTKIMFPYYNAVSVGNPLSWRFPSGAVIGFSHLQHSKDVKSFLSARIPLIIFEQLEQFEWHMFWDILGRNSSVNCPEIRPYCRANFNPDTSSPGHPHIIKMIEWWLDDNNEYPDPEKIGIVRWFVRNPKDDSLVWSDTEAESLEKYPDIIPKSFTFIPATVHDNPILKEKDPTYLSNLQMLPYVQRMQKLYGNMKISESAGNVFKREWFNKCPYPDLDDIVSVCRYWDRAATDKKKKSDDPDSTVGVLMAKMADSTYRVIDVKKFEGTPGKVIEIIKGTAQADLTTFGEKYILGLEQDPAAAGKFEIEYYLKLFTGFNISVQPARQSKLVRANPFSVQCEAGNVLLVYGDWNDVYVDELVGFPELPHDDQVDGSSGAFKVLNESSGWVDWS